MRTRSRPDVVFIAWTRVGGRALEISRALSGEALVVYPFSDDDRTWAIGARYVVSCISTLGYLLRRWPRAVIVTNPPVFPVLISWAYGRVSGAPVVVDAHPGSFGLKRSRIGIKMLRVTKWVTPRVDGALVTVDELARTIESWGGRAVVAHEAPPVLQATSPGSNSRILFVCTFTADEPVELVLSAARLRPTVGFDITGDIEVARRYEADAPANVRFVGYLAPTAYADALGSAAGVIALTTEPTSVLRAGYEAVYSQKPLIVSDTPALREAFPYAEHADHDPQSLARAVDRLLASQKDEGRLMDAQSFQAGQWRRQLAGVARLIAGEHAVPGSSPTVTR